MRSLSAVLFPDPTRSGWWVAFNPETHTTTQGKTQDDALANLKEATELYLSEFPLPRRAKGHHAFLTTLEIKEAAARG